MAENDIRVLFVEDSSLNARITEEMLNRAEGRTFHIHRSETLLGALDLLMRHQFDVALIDLMLPDSEGMHTFLTIQRHAPGLPIVVLTGVSNHSMALSAVKEGAQDYLTKGRLTTDTLVHALTCAIVRGQNRPEGKTPATPSAAIVGMLGAKGGVGATTIACHFASEVKRLTSKRVLLIDLETSSAASTALLEAESEFTTMDAIASPNGLDFQTWSRITFHTPHGFDLLRAPGSARFGETLSVERLRSVLRYASPLYDWIFVDLGKPDSTALELLDQVNETFIVTTPEMLSLYQSSRLLKQIIDVGANRETIHLLLNRKGKPASMSVKDVETALGVPAFATIPDFGHELLESQPAGKRFADQTGMKEQAGKIVSQWLKIEPKPSEVSVVNQFLARLVGANRSRVLTTPGL